MRFRRLPGVHPSTLTFRTVTFVLGRRIPTRHIIRPDCILKLWETCRRRLGGCGHRVREIRAGADLWHLPERVYLPAVAGAVGGDAGLGLPALWEGHSLLRQRHGAELVES